MSESYSIEPRYVLSQPKAASIAFAGCTASFGAAEVAYSPRTFKIPKPTAPVWYYVTIEDDQQTGDDGSRVLRATCQAAHTLVGVSGRTYMGAIRALPAGHAIVVLPGGWPAPSSFQVIP